MKNILTHAGFVQSLARSLVQDEEKAADIAQETWLAALKNPPQKEQFIRPWLARVMRNISYNFFRTERRKSRKEEGFTPPEKACAASKIVEKEETRRRIMDAVLELDEPYQSAILLRFYEDLPVRKVAKQLNLSSETVRTRIKRGLEKIKIKLDSKYKGSREEWLGAIVPILGAPISSSGGVVLSGGLAMTGKAKAVLLILGMICAVVLITFWINQGERKDLSKGETNQYEAKMSDLKINDLSDDEIVNDLKQSTESKAEKSLITQLNSRTVHCQVMNDKNQPIADVIIEEACVTEFRELPTIPDGLKWKETGEKTDSLGNALVQVPKDKAPLTYLRFRHEEHCPEFRRMIYAVKNKDQRFSLDRIRMQPAFLICGRVVDKKGEPVRGCPVYAPHPPAWSKDTWNIKNIYKTVTKGDGTFVLQMKQKNQIFLTAMSQEKGIGFSSKLTPDKKNNAPQVKIEVGESLPIAGRIITETGLPVFNKHVFAEGMIQGKKIILKTLSDQQGHFCFPAAPQATYLVYVSICSKSKAPKRYRRLGELKQVSTGTNDLTIRIPSGSAISVHLTDQQDRLVNAPVTADFVCRNRVKKGKKVRFGIPWSWDAEMIKTDSGDYEYKHLPWETFDITVSASGYNDHTFKSVDIPQKPGLIKLSAKLYPKGKIKGIIKNADKQPAEYATVTLEPWYDWGKSKRKCSQNSPVFSNEGVRLRPRWLRNCKNNRSTTANREGFFSFEEVSNGDYTLIIKIQGQDVHMHGPVQISSDNTCAELMIVLPALTSSIEGIVRDAGKAPIPNAFVIAWDGDQLFNSMRADQNGYYCFSNMPEGNYLLDARAFCTATEHTGGSSRIACDHYEEIPLEDRFNARLAADENLLLDLEVQDPWNGKIQGTVFTHTGVLPENLEVTLQDMNSRKTSSIDLFSPIGYWKQKIQGDSFCFDDLPAGDYCVRLTWGDWNGGGGKSEPPFKLAPSSTHHTQFFIPTASVQGTVLDASTGEPLPEAELWLSSDEKEYSELSTNNLGNFRKDNVKPGDYRILVMHTSYIAAIHSNVNIQEGSHVQGIVIQLHPEGCLVEGVVKGEATSILFEVPGYSLPLWANVSFLGEFKRHNLPAGPLKIIAKYNDKILMEKNITLPLKEGEKIVFDLK